MSDSDLVARDNLEGFPFFVLFSFRFVSFSIVIIPGVLGFSLTEREVESAQSPTLTSNTPSRSSRTETRNRASLLSKKRKNKGTQQLQPYIEPVYTKPAILNTTTTPAKNENGNQKAETGLTCAPPPFFSFTRTHSLITLRGPFLPSFRCPSLTPPPLDGPKLGGDIPFISKKVKTRTNKQVDTRRYDLAWIGNPSSRCPE